MTLPAEEFIRRFLLHVLPHRFVRIRYYGFLAHRHRDRELERCLALLGAAAPSPAPEEREDWQTVFLSHGLRSDSLRALRSRPPALGRRFAWIHRQVATMPLTFPGSRLDRSANGWSPCVLPHICATIEQTKLLWEEPHRADRHLEKALTKRRPLDSRRSGKLQRSCRALLLRIESP